MFQAQYAIVGCIWAFRSSCHFRRYVERAVNTLCGIILLVSRSLEDRCQKIRAQKFAFLGDTHGSSTSRNAFTDKRETYAEHTRVSTSRRGRAASVDRHIREFRTSFSRRRRRRRRCPLLTRLNGSLTMTFHVGKPTKNTKLQRVYGVTRPVCNPMTAKTTARRTKRTFLRCL